VSVTAKDVAKWMVGELTKHEMLDQQSTVYYIGEKFGQQFVYANANGNPAIDKKVLKEFRELTDDTVVWERGQRCWRKRQRHDEPGRQQY
jgi:hypothetical protein